MDQLLVVARKGMVQDLLVSLQSLGVMQISRVDPATEGLERLKLGEADLKTKERWDAVAARAEAIVDFLDARGLKPAPRADVPAAIDDIESYLGDINGQIEPLIAERAEIRDELDVIEAYGRRMRELATSMAQLEGSRYLRGSAFTVAADGLDRLRAGLAEAFDDRYVLSTRPAEEGYLAIVAVHHRDRPALLGTLSRLGISELQLPPRYASYGFAKTAHVMEERARTLPNRLRAIDEELAQHRNQYGARILAVWQSARNHQLRFEALEEMAEGRFSRVLRGWVPREERPRVVDALKKQFGDDVALEFRAADDHHDHDVPVKLDNPKWAQPFEILLGIFAPPRYGHFDPTWTLAIFFPLIFGMIVGDMAFGLLFLVTGMYFAKLAAADKPLVLGPLNVTVPPEPLSRVATIAKWAAAWTIVWGFVYGEFFGNFLEHWPAGNPVFYPVYPGSEAYGYSGMIQILIFRVHESYFPLVMQLALAIGTFQILFGWGLRAYYGWRHRDMKHFWEGIGMIAGVSAVVIFAAAFLMGVLTTPVLVLVGLLALLLVFTIFKTGLIMMPIEVIANGGNILSYLRIFAVGLAAALIAALATDLGFAIANAVAIPVIGALLGIIVAVFINLLAVVIKIIAYTMQPLRLQYVEFFSKFGFYEGSGVPYRPFRLFGGKQ